MEELMDESNYRISENIDFLTWYYNMVEKGYKGYATYELQQLVDAVVLYYSAVDNSISTEKAIEKLPVNDYRFFSCYFRKNIDYDIKNSNDKDTKEPRQDTLELYDYKRKSKLTVYYDESGKLYNIFDERKYGWVFDRSEKHNEDLYSLYMNLKNYEEKLDIHELEDIMFTHSVDLELRQRLAYMINDKLNAQNHPEQAEKFREDASTLFGVNFDRTYHNYIQNYKTVAAYKVRCKKLKNIIDLSVK